ncbi:MAG: hypothetical protein ACP5IE_04590 [Infirmifilum sp.]
MGIIHLAFFLELHQIPPMSKGYVQRVVYGYVVCHGNAHGAAGDSCFGLIFLSRG